MMMRSLFGILCCAVVTNVHVVSASSSVKDDQFTWQNPVNVLAGAGAAAGVYCYGKGGDLSSYAKPLGVGAATFLFSTYAANWFHTDIRREKIKAYGAPVVQNEDQNDCQGNFFKSNWYNARLIAMNLVIGVFSGAASWLKPDMADRYLLGSIVGPSLLLGGAWHVLWTYRMQRNAPPHEGSDRSESGDGSGSSGSCNCISEEQFRKIIREEIRDGGSSQGLVTNPFDSLLGNERPNIYNAQVVHTFKDDSANK